MAAETTANLRLVFSLVQDTGNNVRGLLGDLKSVGQYLKDIASVSLSTVSKQIESVASAAKDSVAGISSLLSSLPKGETGQGSAEGIKNVGDEAADAAPQIEALKERIEELEKKLHDVGEGHHLKHVHEEAEEAVPSLQQLEHLATEFFSTLREGSELFLEMKAFEFAKDIAKDALVGESLGKVLTQIAYTAGVSAEKIHEDDEALQKLGVSAVTSRQTLLALVKAGIDTSQAPTFVQWAKDIAAANGKLQTTGEVLQQLVHVVQRGRPEGLIGLLGAPGNFQAELREYAEANKTTVEKVNKNRQERAKATLYVISQEVKKFEGAAAVSDTQEVVALEGLKGQVKEALGAGLAGSYKEAIHQISEFLKYLKEYFEQNKLAQAEGKELAETIRLFGEAVREVLQFFVQHHDIIFSIVKIWGLWKLAIIGVTALKFIGKNSIELLEWAAKAIFWLSGVGGSELFVAFATEKARIAQEKQAATGLASILGLGGVQKVLKTVAAAWQLVAAAIAEAGAVTLTTVGLIVGLAAVALNVGHSADLIAHYTLDKLRPSGASEYNKAKYGTPKKEESEAEKAKKEADEAGAENKKRAREAKEAYDEWKAAKDRLLSGQTEFQNKVDDYNKVLDGLAQHLKGATVPTEDLRVGLFKIANEVKDTAGLKAFGVAVENYRKTTGDAKGASEAMALAHKSEQDAAREQTAKLVEEARGLAEARGKALEEGLQREEELLKQHNEVVDSIEKFQYAQGQLNIDQYYTNREDRIRQEGQAELAILNQQLNNEIALVKYAQTEKDKIEAKGKVAEIQGKIQILTGTPGTATTPGTPGSTQQKIDQAEIDKTNEILQLQQKIADIRADIAIEQKGEPGRVEQIVQKYKEQLKELGKIGPEGKQVLEAKLQADLTKLYRTDNEEVQKLRNTTDEYYGGLPGKLAAINLKYEEMGHKMAGIYGAAEAIADAKAMEVFKAQIEDANKSLKETQDLEKSQIDLQQVLIERAVKTGAITSDQAEAYKNQLILQQQDIAKAQIAHDQENLVKYQNEIKRKTAEIVEDPQNFGLSTEEMLQKVREGTSEIQHAADGAVIDIRKQQAEIIKLEDQIETYGKKVQDSFQQGFAKAIENTIINAKGAGQAWKDVVTGWEHQIAAGFAKRLSEQITGWLKRKTSEPEIDPKTGLPTGKVKEGTSIFDKLGKLLGIGATSPLGSKANPIWAQIISMPGTKPGESGVPVTNPDFLGGPAPGGGLYFNTGAAQVAASQQAEFDKLVPGMAGLPNEVAGAIKDGSVKGFADAGKNLSGIVNNFGQLFNSQGFQQLGNFLGGLPDIGNPLSVANWAAGLAEGGLISGPGTGTSDSILGRLSHGEFVMPADKTSRHFDLLESIRQGYSSFAGFADGGLVQSIAIPSLLASSMSLRGTPVEQASAVKAGGPSTMNVQMHPDALNMTMRDFFEREVSRQFVRR